MGGVLEGIDQVDWARLTHAYGPAADVPDGVPSGLSADTPFTALDSRQQRLVSALVESPSTWQIGDATFANFSSLIRAYGLPSWWEKLRDYATVA